MNILAIAPVAPHFKLSITAVWIDMCVAAYEGQMYSCAQLHIISENDVDKIQIIIG